MNVQINLFSLGYDASASSTVESEEKSSAESEESANDEEGDKSTTD